MKIFRTVLILTLLLAMLTACGKTENQNTISVTSTYPYLDRLVSENEHL